MVRYVEIDTDLKFNICFNYAVVAKSNSCFAILKICVLKGSLLFFSQYSLRTRNYLSILKKWTRTLYSAKYSVFYTSPFGWAHTEFNSFFPNAPFSPPPENIRKPNGFLMFSEGRQREHWERMG